MGHTIDLVQFSDVNDPTYMYFDVACIMMLTLDLSELFGIMA